MGDVRKRSAYSRGAGYMDGQKLTEDTMRFSARRALQRPRSGTLACTASVPVEAGQPEKREAASRGADRGDTQARKHALVADSEYLLYLP